MTTPLPDRIPSRARGHFINPSISSSAAASDFGDSQFKLEVDDRAEDRAPSRNGISDDGPVSMRSLRQWKMNGTSTGTGSQTPTAPLREWSMDRSREERDRERDRERTITLGVLSGEEGRTPSPRDVDR